VAGSRWGVTASRDHPYIGRLSVEADRLLQSGFHHTIHPLGTGGPYAWLVSKVGGLDDTIWIRPHGMAERRPPRSRLNRVMLVIVLVVIVLGAVLATTAFFSAKDYGTPAFWSLPKHIGYCGNEYDDQGSQMGNPRLFTAQNGTVGAQWTFLSWTFGGDSIYAAVAPLHPPDDTVCTMDLYIPITGSKWETYVLSGGT